MRTLILPVEGSYVRNINLIHHYSSSYIGIWDGITISVTGSSCGMRLFIIAIMVSGKVLVFWYIQARRYPLVSSFFLSLSPILLTTSHLLLYSILYSVFLFAFLSFSPILLTPPHPLLSVSLSHPSSLLHPTRYSLSLFLTHPPYSTPPVTLCLSFSPILLTPPHPLLSVSLSHPSSLLHPTRYSLSLFLTHSPYSTPPVTLCLSFSPILLTLPTRYSLSLFLTHSPYSTPPVTLCLSFSPILFTLPHPLLSVSLSHPFSLLHPTRYSLSLSVVLFVCLPVSHSYIHLLILPISCAPALYSILLHRLSPLQSPIYYYTTR